jgi:hypothetical protein
MDLLRVSLLLLSGCPPNVGKFNITYKFENTIYLGNGRFFAFPFGEVTEQELKDNLKDYAKNKDPKNIRDLGISRFPILPAVPK